MGQKVHPIGLRVGIIRTWDSKWYRDKGYADGVREDHEIRKLIREKHQDAAISRVEIERRGTNTSVILHTGKPGILVGKGGQGLEAIRKEIGKITGTNVHVDIREIRYPDIDAQLVADSIAQQISKRVAFKRAMRQAVQRAIRMGAKGIRVSCAGRLGGAEMARREQMREGKIPLHTLRADIDYGFAEGKTTYGNIGVKVWIYRGDVLPGSERPTESEIVPARETLRAERAARTDAGGRTGRGRTRGGRGRAAAEPTGGTD